MRPIVLSLLLGFLLPNVLLAQLENKGWWTRALFTYHSDYDAHALGPDLGRSTANLLTQPEIGYAISKRFLVGIIAQYGHNYQRQEISPLSTGQTRYDNRYFGAGPLVRYFIPLGPRVSLMPEVFFTYYWGEITTEITGPVGQNISRNRNNSIGAGTFPSLVCFLTRDLACSLTVASLQYYGNKDRHQVIVQVNPQQWILGIEYYFDKKPSAEKP